MSNIFFNKLMNIQLLHEYYADGICANLMLQTADETQSLLNGYGIFFKPSAQGATLLYESIDESGTPKIPIDSAIKLTFFLSTNSSYFTNFTDADFSEEPRSVYYFCNNDPGVIENGNDFTIINNKLNSPISLITKYLKVNKASGTASYILLTDADSKDTQVSFHNDKDELTVDMGNFESGKYELKQFDAGDIQIGNTVTLYYNKSFAGSIPFAVFELFLDENDMLSLPLNFIFNFKSRETFWRYKILSKEANPPTNDYTIDATTVSIIHNPSEGDTLSFEAATGSDPIVIRSTDKLKLKERGFDQIGLYRGEENVLISNLPNPSPVKLEKVGNDWYSDIYVYVYV